MLVKALEKSGKKIRSVSPEQREGGLQRVAC